MIRRDRPSSITFIFYLAFAAWFAALRYQAPSFYHDIVGGWLEIALNLTIVIALAALLIVVVIRAFRRRGRPWTHLLIIIGAIGVAEFIWRLGISRGPPDFKLVGMFFDVGTPLVAALGILSFVFEFRKRRTEGPTQTP
jgi:hypothetical protein